MADECKWSIALHNGRKSDKIFGVLPCCWKFPFAGPFLKGDIPFISLFPCIHLQTNPLKDGGESTTSLLLFQPLPGWQDGKVIQPQLWLTTSAYSLPLDFSLENLSLMFPEHLFGERCNHYSFVKCKVCMWCKTKERSLFFLDFILRAWLWCSPKLLRKWKMLQTSVSCN